MSAGRRQPREAAAAASPWRTHQVKADIRDGGGVAHLALPALLAIGLTVSRSSAASITRLDMDSVRSVEAAGAAVQGQPEPVAGTREGALLLRGGVAVTVPSRDRFNPGQGYVDFRAQPHWPPDDTGRHTFFHTGDANAHVTVFLHGGDRLLFVYKGNPSAWRAAQLKIEPWQPGTWHRVTAAWQETERHGVVLFLAADGDRAAGSGAVRLPVAPETVFFGARGRGEPAEAAFDQVVLSTEFSLPSLAPLRAEHIPVRVDTRSSSGPMPRTFSFVTPWNSRTNPIPFTREHPYFRRFREAGFELVRLVAFSESWLWGTRVTRDAEGGVELDFSDFDTLLDLYRDAGAEPYIRLAYHMPKALASHTAGTSRAKHAYTAPESMDEWRELIRRIVHHCNVERSLGIRYWVAMLNEADIPIRKGLTTWEPILELYEETVKVVKSIDPGSRVGGPATCGPLPGVQEDAIRTFLRFCKQRDLPPDFLCFHAYKRPHPRDYETAVDTVKRIVEEEWPGLSPETFLDEWNLWADDARQSNEYGAAYLAAAVHYQTRAGLTRSSIVSFNSHLSSSEMEDRGAIFRGPFRKGDTRWGGRFYAAQSEIGGAERPVLYTHSVPGKGRRVRPYTFGRFTVTIPPQASLRVGTALAFSYEGADGCGMSLRVLDGQTEHLVLTTHARTPEWSEHTVDLSRFANRTVQVEFRTDCGAAGNTAADHAIWGSPRIEAAGVAPYDLCEHISEATTGCVLRPGEWYEESPSLPLIKGNILTPAYFTWVLLNQLRGERLSVELDGRDGIHDEDVAGALACRDGRTVRVLLWHFDGDRAEPGLYLDTPEARATRTIDLRLEGMTGSWRVRRLLIDHDHTNAYTDYGLKGADDRNGRFNLDDGEVDVVEDRAVRAEDGALALVVRLRNLSVCLVELVPE